MQSNKHIFFIVFSLLAGMFGILAIPTLAGIGLPHSAFATSFDTNGNYDKVIILNFDDGRLSQYTNAKPVLDKYGFKATFYVVCDYIGKKPGYMDWNEIETLHREGHDIGSHSMDHVHLDKLPKKDIEYQVGESKICLQKHGINVTSFAYPFDGGSDDKTVVDIVAKYYDLARSGNDALTYLRCNSPIVKPPQTDCRTYTDGNDLTYANRYTVRGWSQDAARAQNTISDSMMVDKFIRIVNSQTKYNNAGTIKAIPIIIYHHVGDNSRGIYNTDMKLFETQMKYLHDNGYRVLTMADLGYDEQGNYLYIKGLKSETEQPVERVTAPAIAPTTNATTNVTAPTITPAIAPTGNPIIDALKQLFGLK
ncbi:MAG TPA: polysaccharide deacetylase family protein [Nitrososphaeraceae archaeon]